MSQSRIDELRGEQTETYYGLFDCETPIFGNSKLYYVTNVGQNRGKILEYLRDRDVEILEEESIFKYTLIVLEGNKVIDIGDALEVMYNCRLQWDGAC